MQNTINSLYLIGSLRNDRIPVLGNKLRAACPGLEVFDDWFAAGPEADDYWQKYEKLRGHTYPEALENHAARNVFEFDKRHLDRVDATLLVLPAGRSGHIELGYSIGNGKRGFILLDGEPDRFDVMYLFAERVFHTEEEALEFFAEASA